MVENHCSSTGIDTNGNDAATTTSTKSVGTAVGESYASDAQKPADEDQEEGKPEGTKRTENGKEAGPSPLPEKKVKTGVGDPAAEKVSTPRTIKRSTNSPATGDAPPSSSAPAPTALVPTAGAAQEKVATMEGASPTAA
ncbi:hypothetical protein G7K_3178-t1 [Saitoella complicata NRRL Y-17804]|uniref:Uncharacterized protein n=1 Tax=Saitoella complicata (strain BCRC 22490 / CBS 7301 / JCM 7358 / NBRC 10748 / NRRL Y-17804) TaxID=698492 RepID=A0A0E9NGL4_SAICN|nr:hypothetical protein G7K_3178-t1 [Saitoella complicata NRRL Y-17804]